MKHRLATVAIASAILLTIAVVLFSQGSGYNSYQTNTFTGVAVGSPSVFQNSLIKFHQLIWTVTGTVTSCTVALDTSADNVTFTAGGAIAGQTCTSNGSSSITGIVSANYVRVNMTAFVGTGSVVVVYEGWAYNPAGVVFPLLPTAAGNCSAPPYSFSGVPTYGLDFGAIQGFNAVIVCGGGIRVGTFEQQQHGWILNALGSTGLFFSNGDPGSNAPDLGITRGAAGNAFIGNGGNGDVTGTITPGKYATGTNCAAVGTAANPSVASCSSSAAGSFSCATNASTGTCVVNTTAVTANSEIFVTQRSDTTTGTRLGVTCNATLSTVITEITAVTAATSFTINLGTIATNPECFSYYIIN